MAQKNKVKELVGRGLNSYHTKALQQMDRIEKKNKEQNHKISILSNELDNDYLTKTEEGSVISLEHSKEGMVYLDELQGNTLVNYCTDGSKELTLNGDIDVEGTFVTTTEGVDGGKIDVICEGNTLVNLVDKMRDLNQPPLTVDSEYITIIDHETNHRQYYYTISNGQLNLIKPNTTYTIIAEITKNTLQRNFTLINNFQANQGDITSDSVSVPIGFVGRYVGKFTTLSDFTNRNRLGFSAGSGNRGEITLRNNFIILEGDWTNRELPTSYFEGMKSVGQDDENGHKIEILSKNDNLFIPTQYIPNGWSFGNMIVNHTLYRSYWIKCKPNTTYFVESDRSGNRFGVSCSDRIELNGVAFPVTKGEIYGSSDDTDKVQSIIFTTDATAKYLYVYTTNNGVFPTPKIMISEGSSEKPYIAPQSNKKEILINEPLRSVGNTKDKFVKIGSKWFIEKKCEEIVFDGSDDEKWSFKVTEPSGKYSYMIDPAIVNSNNSRPNGICDKFTFVNWNSNPWNYKSNCISILSNGVYVYTDFTTLSEFKTWLQSNPFTLIYELPTPKYEPLEIEPVLNTYNDITHISNNSIIPCNMKIQNSGYNAIIKPSTLYTVALDTNKAGTIGMNLGGAKGTTTNNVLTLTTPATLTDDSLRLYGKGIKASKVRLLEGDKTNWIPSHFEGMKSCFEDKLQDDGTYKMEILMNNKNLFNINWTKRNSSGGVTYKISNNNIIVDTTDKADAWAGCYMPLVQLQPNTEYSIRCDRINGFGAYIIGIKDSSGSNVADFKESMEYKSFVTPSNGIVQLRFFTQNTQQNSSYQTIFKNIVLCKGNKIVDYTEPKSNKIQFSSIEPLRGVGNIKDKFVFKDNKLMIQRNCKQIAIQNSDIDTLVISNNLCSDNYLIFYMENLLGRIENDRFSIKSNKFATRWTLDGNSKSICEGIFGEQIIGYSTRVYVSIDKKRLTSLDKQGVVKWLVDNKVYISYLLEEPTYEEVPFELQKIILEGYENGTLFFDTNIPPTVTTTYSGETPIVKATRLNKTEVLNNTEDINDNIIPYLMDMDYRVVMLQLATEELEGGVSMARLFGGTYEMIKRDILSKRLTREEYGYRLADYFNAGKLTEEQVRELEELR